MTHVEHAGREARLFRPVVLRANAEYGVSWAGFKTTVQPAANAAAALRVIIAEGKFHGVSSAQTPTGSLIVPRCAPGIWLGMFCRKSAALLRQTME